MLLLPLNIVCYTLYFILWGTPDTLLFLIANALAITSPLTIPLCSSIVSKREGIEMGRSYPRASEVYAGTDTMQSHSSSMVAAIGSEDAYYIDYLHEPNPHVLMVGSTSSGKTTTMRAFIARIYGT